MAKKQESETPEILENPPAEAVAALRIGKDTVSKVMSFSSAKPVVSFRQAGVVYAKQFKNDDNAHVFASSGNREDVHFWPRDKNLILIV